MEGKGKIAKVLFVNKYGPFGTVITGHTANELANYLYVNGVDVEFLSMEASYRSNRKTDQEILDYPKKLIRSSYDGDHPMLRFIFSLVDGFRLFLKSLRIKKDVIIVMTEPPLLFLWFQLFRWTYRAKLIYWTMDVYPEAFVAGKFIKESNVFFRIFKRIVYSRPPDFLIVLGNEQLRFLESKFKCSVQHAMIPCGVIHKNYIQSNPSISNGKIVFGYSGNLGAAHDPEFLVELIHQLDEKKHHIVLSLYGTKAESIKKLFKENKSVSFKNSVSYEDIASMDVNIASLLPAWNHICVPSKAVTAICCGSTLLINSNKSADTWKMFSQAGWLVEPEMPYQEQISNYLSNLNKAEILSRKEKAKIIASKCLVDTQEAYESIHVFIDAR